VTNLPPFDTPANCERNPWRPKLRRVLEIHYLTKQVIERRILKTGKTLKEPNDFDGDTQ
jgi:hypothetical protein